MNPSKWIQEGDTLYCKKPNIRGMYLAMPASRGVKDWRKCLRFSELPKPVRAKVKRARA